MLTRSPRARAGPLCWKRELEGGPGNDYLNGGNSSTDTEEDSEEKVVAEASTYDSQKTSDAFDDLFNN